MTEYQTHAALVQSLEAEVSRLRAINAELRARESTSLRQRADAWMAVCALLRELRPSWQEGPGSAQEQALEAIRAMAAQPAAVEQEPVLVVEREPSYMDRGHFYKGDKPHIDPTKVWKLPIGTKLYTAPQPARQPLTDEQIDNMVVTASLAERDLFRRFARAVERDHGIGGEA